MSSSESNTSSPDTSPKHMNSAAAVLPFSRRENEEVLPPQSIETEESILGGLLFQPDSFDRILDTLTPEMFYITAHQELYRVLYGMYADDEVIDLLTVTTKLIDLGKLDRIGGKSKLAMLFERCLSTVNIDHHAQLVARLYWFRQMIKTGQEITHIGYGQGDLSEALDLVDSKIYGLVTKSTQAKEEDESIGALATSWFLRFDERVAGNETPAAKTGFYDLDDMTNGLLPSRLTVLMARPGQGKTALALNIARNVAQSTQKTVAFFSLEMEREDVFTRLISTEARIDSKRLESGRGLSDDEMNRSIAALATLGALPLHINDTCYSVESIRAQARKLAKKPEGLSLIIIDHLIYMLKGSSDPVRDAGNITKGLVALAKELKVPIILVQQLNRNVESRQDKRPMMSDGRQSGETEEDAHNIWALYREEYYNPDTPHRGIAELINLKNRSGGTGTVKLLFEPQYGTFKNLATSHRPAAAPAHRPPAPTPSFTPVATPTPEPHNDPPAIEVTPEELSAALFGQTEEFDDDLDF